MFELTEPHGSRPHPSDLGARRQPESEARRPFALALLLAVLVTGWSTLPAAAQLSPGKLSRPHVSLEGNQRCLECHSQGKGVDSSLCLSCHVAIRDRIQEGEGLHARADYRRSCEKCHIEHHGRDFELVWWGEQGQSSFDHRLTGYRLEGSHADLGCRSCHQPDLILNGAALVAGKANLTRTFLGLGTSCASCHSDSHEGQFGTRSCESCHGQEAWSPTTDFDHDQAAFALTGKHQQVDCAACHKEERLPSGESFVRFKPLAHQSCSACHSDPHDRRFGTDCQACHSTRDWSEVDRSGFDHDRTRYPLRGRHRRIACESCHGSGRQERFEIPNFDRCQTCHSDPHWSQFLAAGETTTSCESCHGVDRFAPSDFGVAEHRSTGFALQGAHETAPCAGCHPAVPPEVLEEAGFVPLGSAARPALVQQFRGLEKEESACADCHRNPHPAAETSVAETLACVECHQVTTWSEVGFDHATTGFELMGAHGRQACASCHPPSLDSDGLRVVDLAQAPSTCRGCHGDPHVGQFDEAGLKTPCLDCHAFEDWQAVGFDHNRDTDFPLEGGHRAVACQGCHPTAEAEGTLFVRYKPLAHDCVDCHQPTGVQDEPPIATGSGAAGDR